MPHELKIYICSLVRAQIFLSIIVARRRSNTICCVSSIMHFLGPAEKVTRRCFVLCIRKYCSLVEASIHHTMAILTIFQCQSIQGQSVSARGWARGHRPSPCRHAAERFRTGRCRTGRAAISKLLLMFEKKFNRFSRIHQYRDVICFLPSKWRKRTLVRDLAWRCYVNMFYTIVPSVLGAECFLVLELLVQLE